ncbi:MAG: flavodoxin domain-containing protein [Sphaerochaetaceae bacterium]
MQIKKLYNNFNEAVGKRLGESVVRKEGFMKVAIVFYSGTGNTEAMAEAVREGAVTAGAETSVIPPETFTPEIAQQYDAIAFGCPSMGVEVLEEDVFEPMFEAVLPSLSAKKIALFGSYGWGDGEWMRDWEERTQSGGVTQLLEPVIANEMPDSTALEACRALGASLAS